MENYRIIYLNKVKIVKLEYHEIIPPNLICFIFMKTNNF